MSGRPFQPVLLAVQAAAAAPFSLLANAADDRHFVPFVATHRCWEPAETLLLLRTLLPGMTVVDVGAHVGYYSVLLSRAVGPSGHVHAFEPAAENRRLLRANLLLNACDNVTVHAEALAARVGREVLALASHNHGDHRLGRWPGRALEAVSVTRLDAALPGLHIDLLKLDVQGGEPAVLAGAATTLATQRGHLACLAEFAPGLLADRVAPQDTDPARTKLSGSDVDAAIAALAAQLAALDARAHAVHLRGTQVTVSRLQPLVAGLAALRDQLARQQQRDASCDLLLFFSAEAEAVWLQRFRDGPRAES